MVVLKGAYVDNALQHLFNFQSLSLDYTQKGTKSVTQTQSVQWHFKG